MTATKPCHLPAHTGEPVGWLRHALCVLHRRQVSEGSTETPGTQRDVHVWLQAADAEMVVLSDSGADEGGPVEVSNDAAVGEDGSTSLPAMDQSSSWPDAMQT